MDGLGESHWTLAAEPLRESQASKTQRDGQRSLDQVRGERRQSGGVRDKRGRARNGTEPGAEAAKDRVFEQEGVSAAVDGRAEVVGGRARWVECTRGRGRSRDERGSSSGLEPGVPGADVRCDLVACPFLAQWL